MYAVSAEYLGRREYEVTVEANGKTVKQQFIEPLFDSSKAARRIEVMVERLNVELDIDVSNESIFDALVAAADKAGKKWYILSCY